MIKYYRKICLIYDVSLAYFSPIYYTLHIKWSFLTVLLDQCFSTGVPRHFGVPWASSRCAAEYVSRIFFHFYSLLPSSIFVSYKNKSFHMKFVKCLELNVCRKINLNVKCAANQKRLRTTGLDQRNCVSLSFCHTILV